MRGIDASPFPPITDHDVTTIKEGLTLLEVSTLLGHANCPPPYPQAEFRGTILYTLPQKKEYEFCT